MNAVTAILGAEHDYPGGDLSANLALAHRHVTLVAAWLAATQGAPQSALAAVRFVDAQHLRGARSALLLRDGAGAALVPEGPC